MSTHTVERTCDVEASADAVWAVIADFGSINDWWPAGGLEKVDIEGEGVGMIRHIHTVVKLVLSERLDAIDPETRTLHLSITGDLPPGMDAYRAVGRVLERGPDAATIHWAGTFEAADDAGRQAAEGFLNGAYQAMFTGISEFLKR